MKLYSRNTLLINFALLSELGKENPDINLASDMPTKSTIMTMHQVFPFMKMEKSILGVLWGKPVFGDNVIIGKVSIDALFKEKQLDGKINNIVGF